MLVNPDRVPVLLTWAQHTALITGLAGPGAAPVGRQPVPDFEQALIAEVIDRVERHHLEELRSAARAIVFTKR
jgi:hypothetical protein